MKPSTRLGTAKRVEVGGFDPNRAPHTTHPVLPHGIRHCPSISEDEKRWLDQADEGPVTVINTFLAPAGGMEGRARCRIRPCCFSVRFAPPTEESQKGSGQEGHHEEKC